MDDDDNREAIGRCEHYIDLYIVSLMARKEVMYSKKYSCREELFWRIVSANKDDFLISLNRECGSLRTIRKIGKERCGLEKQFMRYIVEIMGNGAPQMPSVDSLMS